MECMRKMRQGVQFKYVFLSEMEVMGYYMPLGACGRMPADVMKGSTTPLLRRRQIGAQWEAAVNTGLEVLLHV